MSLPLLPGLEGCCNRWLYAGGGAAGTGPGHQEQTEEQTEGDRDD